MNWNEEEKLKDEKIKCQEEEINRLEEESCILDIQIFANYLILEAQEINEVKS